MKLYKFWNSVEDAPQDIAAINEDLQYLISVFKKIQSTKGAVGECVAEGIQHCWGKLLVRYFSILNLLRSDNPGTQHHCGRF